MLPAPVGAGEFVEARARQEVEHGAVVGRFVGDEPVDAAQAEPVGGPGQEPVLQAGAVVRGVDVQVADVGQARRAGVAFRAGQGRVDLD